ncbi:nucleobase:cation symporter-2 family protein [Kitasatospora sp. NPDC058162]|uniref:nucleobase:cation symporter-2 family protein n=1 Tax=Kitasatospora sp. NPDC058162 TaxID=3346362 RepID=UPI0036DAAE00
MSQAPDVPASGSTAAPARHPVDEVLPPARLGLLGLQHVLVMYTGCVTVPLVFGAAAKLDTTTIGLLINADLLVAGLVTLIQALGIGKVLGVRLPVVAGATFTAVTPMMLIAGEYGMQAVYGSMIAAGFFGLLVAVPFARAVRFFPPLVSGSVITVIGLSLIGVAAGLIAGHDSAAKDYAAPSHLALAGGIVLLIVLVNRFTSGFLSQLGVLLGLIVGTLVAFPMGLTDFSSVDGADWFGLSAPFHFGAPHFPIAAVISMCVVMLVTFTESTADMLAVGEMTGRPLSRKDLARGLAADGVSGVFGGIMNGFLDTVFAQNVGLVGMTKVRSRFVAAVAGGILLVLALIPKLGEEEADGGAVVPAGDGVEHDARDGDADEGTELAVGVEDGARGVGVLRAGRVHEGGGHGGRDDTGADVGGAHGQGAGPRADHRLRRDGLLRAARRPRPGGARRPPGGAAPAAGPAPHTPGRARSAPRRRPARRGPRRRRRR